MPDKIKLSFQKDSPINERFPNTIVFMSEAIVVNHILVLTYGTILTPENSLLIREYRKGLS